jgi:aspartyl-tRNA synthetase
MQQAFLRDCYLEERSPDNYSLLGTDKIRGSHICQHLSDVPTELTIVGRIARIRKKSNKMCFILLRDETVSLQVLFTETKDGEEPTVTREYIKNTVAKITPESLVKITGKIVRTPFDIDSASLSKCEMKGSKIELISASDVVPIQIYQPDAGLDARLNNRILDLRAPRNQLIFKIQSRMMQLVRQFLNMHHFTEINTPKIMAGASESGSEVFKLDYFGQSASLAQSPQLFKQMIINSGFGNVFEIGPVFRAEKSDGSRHLTQYTSIDIEMEIKYAYHEVINLLHDFIVFVVIGLTENHSELLNEWKKFNPEYEGIKIPPKPIIITYKTAVELLQSSKHGCQRPEDINHQDEYNLGVLIKEKYDSDLFVIDKYPKDIRPFYSYVDTDETTRSYDFVLRGCEILSGAQRINDHATLVESAKTKMGDIEAISSYLESFRFGSPPHGGGAFGMERLVAKILNIENIRETCMFPRDPNRLVP